MNSFFFYIELKFKPFATPELNSLSSTASFVVIATIYGGLFSSINEDTVLPIVIMILLILLNIYFILLFFQNYIKIRLSLSNNEKINKIMNKLFGNFWVSGKKN